MKTVIFLIRAYNDFDIQMSLADAFANEPDFKVRVIGYPCDGNIGNPGAHEAASYLRSKNISIETVFDSRHAPCALKFIHQIEKFFRDIRKTRTGDFPGLSFILKAAHVTLLRALVRAFQKPVQWLEDMASEWNAAAIVLDEVSAQPNRSQIADSILPRLAASGTKIYTIQTGQNLYNDPFPSSGKRPAYKPSISTRTFLPSQHDKHIYGIQFPDEKTEIIGNLRMNAAWIKKLHSEILAPRFYNKSQDLAKLPTGKTRVVFMLSKISYGIINAKTLADTIIRAGHMPGIAVAIKPHTRGMKLDFLDPAKAGNAIDASDIPSPVLTEWADILLFTGSGIAFHALFLGKRVGLLKYCQKLDTIFDDGAAIDVLRTPEQVDDFIQTIQSGDNILSDEKKTEIAAWLHCHVEGSITDGDIAGEYKHRIMQDLNYT